MQRWYIEDETKNRLDLFKSKIEIALTRPNMTQDGLMQLFLKHEDSILEVILAAESANNNAESLKEKVPA